MITPPPSPPSQQSLPDRVVRLETTTNSHDHRISRLEVVVWLLGWLLLNQKLALALMDLSESFGDWLRG
jgi:hypothetical protein